MGKLLFFDIDGTLCMPGKAPSEATVQAIRAARAKGHRAFLSTGRNITGIPKAVFDIGFDGYITNAGASAEVDGRLLVDLPLSPELLRQTLEILYDNDVCFALQSDRDNYTDNDQNAAVTAALDPVTASHIGIFMNVLKLTDIKTRPDAPGYKICFVAPSSEHWERIRPRMEQWYDITLFDNLFPTGRIVSGEFNRHGTDKGKALQAICAHFGQTAGDAIAFGDSTNDSAMLIAAGVGYAMENAQDEVKAIADAVCPHCDEDGVARTLQALGLC